MTVTASLLHGAADDAALALSMDDRSLIRAIAIVGDVMKERELERLLERWAWGRPMSRARVGELEALGVLCRVSDGWFVTHEADALVGDALGDVVGALLMACVGGIVCHEAESVDRFGLGLRRVLASGDEGAAVELCRAWAGTPAGLAGPRGDAFVEAVGLGRAPTAVRARIASAVPEPSPWGMRLARHAWQTMRSRGASALVMLLVLTLVFATACGRSTPATRPEPAVAPSVPDWYTSPPREEGKLFAVAARTSGEVPRAVDAAVAEARGTLERALRGRVPDARERAAAATRRDYLIVPGPRGFTAYVLLEVSVESR